MLSQKWYRWHGQETLRLNNITLRSDKEKKKATYVLTRCLFFMTPTDLSAQQESENIFLEIKKGEQRRRLSPTLSSSTCK